MAERHREGFWINFKRLFIRGLATVLPTILTIVLLVKCYEFVQDNISRYITEGVIHIVHGAVENYPEITTEDRKDYFQEHKLTEQDNDPALEDEIRLWKLRQTWSHGPRSLVGFLLAIIMVYFIGFFLASYLGRKVWQVFEHIFMHTPGFKQLYPYIKQVTEFLFGERHIQRYTRVVAVEYPRKGIWSVGLVTGGGLTRLRDHLQEDLLTVFIPSSPTPVTGYVITVDKNDVIDLPLTIEETLRFCISGGVITPQHPLSAELTKAAIPDKDKLIPPQTQNS
ncbi:MAG: DUF502 domain-containing protein [Sedimentisphaerales bacterium]|nr:DUF502 domain-containing protein [Sedimentisphaerales bacterium]